jgi:hypothetical protein
MKKFILPLAGGIGLLLAACLAAPGDSGTSTSAALSCGGNERAFNGACRTVCTSTSQCGGSNQCMTVSAGVALCIDYTACAYLGGDTECAGVPYGGYGGYGYSSYTSYDNASYGSYDPYWVEDPYSSSYESYGSYSAGPFGCGGNAVWHSQPPAPTDDPKCGEAHQVVRCRKVGNRCALVEGTTMDVADR